MSCDALHLPLWVVQIGMTGHRGVAKPDLDGRVKEAAAVGWFFVLYILQ